jgi:adenosylcobinamide kinase/adenosylcobinamide-phosphate guanylyltransferase
MKYLVLGGTRSGKSNFAESTAVATDKRLVYIATAQALDKEMHARILHHQSSRIGQWITVEEPLSLAASLQQHSAENNCILVDCLTLWLTNILLAGEEVFQHEHAALLETLPQLAGDIIFVSNEVGMGIVAADPLSRRFVDEAGRLHQALGKICDKVTLVVAGLPLQLK